MSNWGDYTLNKFTQLMNVVKKITMTQYTPLWVKAPKHEELCEYEANQSGWEMVQALIKDKQIILFPTTKLEMKKYMDIQK